MLFPFWEGFEILRPMMAPFHEYLQLAETNWFFILLSLFWRWWRFLVRSWLYLSCLYRRVCVCPSTGFGPFPRHLHCRLMVSLFCENRVLSRGPEVVECLDPMEQKKNWEVEKPSSFWSWRMEKSTHSLGATGGESYWMTTRGGTPSVCINGRHNTPRQ